MSRKQLLKRTGVFFFSLPLLCLSACGGGHDPAPTVALALEGPPLAIVGEYMGMALEGGMDRAGMAGYGSIHLRGERDGQEFACEAKIDSPPTEKARIRGVLQCTGEKALAFSLRNLGPDQGLGIAREPGGANMMVFFYHVSREEAMRRLPGVKEDIARMQQALLAKDS